MKISKILCTLWLITSCTSNNFQKIELLVETDKADHVQVFWNDTYIGNYNEENSIKKLAGKGENSLMYDLSNHPNIKAIRIDLGDKKTARNMILKGIIFHNDNQSKVIKGHSLKQYLEGNDEVLYDSIQKAFKLNHNKVGDPYLISKNLDKLF